MPQPLKSPQKSSPSAPGSTPVRDVLDRIRVRDPQHHPSGIYGRRFADYEISPPRLQMVLWVACGLAVSTFTLQKLAERWNVTSVRAPKAAVMTPAKPWTAPARPLSIRRPTAARRPIVEETIEAANVPENLQARFMGPRQLEIQWDGLGEGYLYRVYTSPASTMAGAQPATENPVPSTNMAWIPDDGVQDVWLAVKAISKDGRETPFSRPVLVQLPRY